MYVRFFGMKHTYKHKEISRHVHQGKYIYVNTNKRDTTCLLHVLFRDGRVPELQRLELEGLQEAVEDVQALFIWGL